MAGDRPSGGAELREYQRRLPIQAAHRYVLAVVKELAPTLFAGLPGATLSKDDLGRLLAAIAKDADGLQLRQRHNFLVKGLSKGRKTLNWDVDVPAYMSLARRDPSPFTPEQFQYLHALRKIEKRFLTALVDPRFYHNDNEYLTRVRIADDRAPYDLRQLHAGQLLFSAVLKGALIDRRWLAPLMVAIEAGPCIDGGHLWFELRRLTSQDDPDSFELKRWIPDPLTTGLLFGFYKRHGSAWPRVQDAHVSPSVLITRFLTAIGLSQAQRPKVEQLRQLLWAVATYHRLHMHGYLVDYAQGRNVSLSLPTQAWLRFRWSHTRRLCGPVDGVVENQSVSVRRPRAETGREPPHYKDQREQLRDLQEIVQKVKNSKNQKVGAVTKALDKYISDKATHTPILVLLAEWLCDMMRSKRVTGTKIKPSSARTYLSAIGKPMVDYGADMDILGLCSDDFGQYYKKVLACAKAPKTRAYKRERLVAFHTYLVLEYGVPSVEIEGCTAGSGSVDANVITPTEYLEAKGILESASGTNERWRTIRRLVLMVGYKCGLRREEVETLYVSDVQDRPDQQDRNDYVLMSPRPELIVRTNPHAGLKTISSTRRIPLHAFLTQDEMNDLFAWKTQRLQECGRKPPEKSLLFCEKGSDGQRISDRQVFRPITRALQLACGDPAMRFHHLRHSFANMTFLRLMAEEMPQLDVASWFGESAALWPALAGGGLRGRLLVQKDLGSSRRMLYALSALCGHVDPRETLNSYLHVLDWCLGRHAWSDTAELPLEAQAAIEGLALGSLRVRRSREGIAGPSLVHWAQSLIDRHAKRFSVPATGWVEREAQRVPEITVDDGMASPSAALLYQIFQSLYSGVSVQTAADMSGFSVGQIIEWRRRAAALVRLSTARGTGRLVRRTAKNPPAKHLIERRPTLPNMTIAPPRLPAEAAEAERLFAAIIEEHADNAELVQQGIQLVLRRTSRAETWLNLVGDDEKRLFIKFVRWLGVPERRLRLEVEHLPGVDAARVRSAWARRLNIPKKNIVLIERADIGIQTKKTRDPMGLAHLWIASPGVQEVGRRMYNQHLTWPSHALRFAVYMGAVYLGVDPNTVTRRRPHLP